MHLYKPGFNAAQGSEFLKPSFAVVFDPLRGSLPPLAQLAPPCAACPTLRSLTPLAAA